MPRVPPSPSISICKKRKRHFFLLFIIDSRTTGVDIAVNFVDTTKIESLRHQLVLLRIPYRLHLCESSIMSIDITITFGGDNVPG